MLCEEDNFFRHVESDVYILWRGMFAWKWIDTFCLSKVVSLYNKPKPTLYSNWRQEQIADVGAHETRMYLWVAIAILILILVLT